MNSRSAGLPNEEFRSRPGVPVDTGSGLKENRHIIKHTAEHLAAVYGVPHNESENHPPDELISTILSQSTTSVNSQRAFRSFKQRFPNWETARHARPATIATTIKSGGLANVKSVVIKNILQEIKRRCGSLELSFLRTTPLIASREFLLSLKGVGPKTARCVLLFACNHPVFPMDTHIFRITRRMGLIPDKSGDQESHRLM